MEISSYACACILIFHQKVEFTPPLLASGLTLWLLFTGRIWQKELYMISGPGHLELLQLFFFLFRNQQSSEKKVGLEYWILRDYAMRGVLWKRTKGPQPIASTKAADLWVTSPWILWPPTEPSQLTPRGAEVIHPPWALPEYHNHRMLGNKTDFVLSQLKFGGVLLCSNK